MSKQVNDQSSMHRYRTEIPNIIDDMDLSVYAFRLYVKLKRVAGDDGKCFYTTRQLAELCRMSVGAVSKAKQELVDADLIRVESDGKWVRDNITIVDLWPANFAYFAQEKEQNACSPHEQTAPSPCSPHEHPVHTVNTPVHHMNAKEEPIKKEPIKEEPKSEMAAPSLAADVDFDRTPAPAKPLTPQQEMYGAICEALGWDYHVIAEREKVRVAQAVKILHKANYGVDDIRRFMVEVWFKDWRWEKFKQYPTLEQLRQEIGKTRSAVPAAAPPPKAKGMDSFNRLAASIRGNG